MGVRMAMIRVSKGEHFIKRGDKMNEIYMVTEGKISRISAHDEIVVGSGTIIGLMECITGVYQGDYIAREDSVIYPLPYTKTDDFKVLFKNQPAYIPAFFITAIKEADMLLTRYDKYCKKAQQYYQVVMASYQQYQELCTRFGQPNQSVRRMDSMEQLTLSEQIDAWELAYYHALNKQNGKEMLAACHENCDIVIGQILQAGRMMVAAVRGIDEIFAYLQYNAEICLNSQRTDLLQLYFDLAMKCAQRGADVTEMTNQVKQLYECCKTVDVFEQDSVEARFEEYLTYDFTKVQLLDDKQEDVQAEAEQAEEQEEDCFLHIVTYAGMKEEDISVFRSKLLEYQNVPENLELEESTRKMRRDIGRIFYKVYRDVFKRVMDEKEEPSAIIKMFLNFGFMDVAMVGEDVANELYDLTDKLFLCKSEHVYTVFEWLKSIYQGQNEPSRNEFDLDYDGYLSEQKRRGKLTEQQVEKMKTDCWLKTQFEMENMFQSTNRATYGRITMFCPILSARDMIQSAEKMLITAQKVEDALNDVRKIDFSLFYHDVSFSDPAHGVNREELKKEILPDVILMPNVGTRAMMWQETAGIRRDTSARFVFPIMTTASFTDMMIEVCGRYRWEICRKIQGMRWNDITDKSLTSEYSDYIQYYRKNHDLSSDAREKIRNALYKAKNNYREVFVADYINWVKYEANGSYRLNKVSRDILFRYCPFAEVYRERLAGNPLYQELISRYKILNARQIKRITGFNEKYEKGGGEITMELEENLAFYYL